MSPIEANRETLTGPEENSRPPSLERAIALSWKLPYIDSIETQTHIKPRWQETVDVCCMLVLIYAGLC